MKMKDKISFAPRPLRLGDQAYNMIKEDVIVCRLPPGTEVTESGLAEHYRLGLAPIRTALSRLCQEGFFTAIPRRGYLITPITAQTVKDVFDLRLLLEPAAARAAAGRVNGELLRRLGAGPFEQGGGARERQFLKNNRNFHVEIARASGNGRMAKILESVLDEMERLLHLGLFARRDNAGLGIDYELQRRQHKALIDALTAGDAMAAEKAAIEHVEHSRELVMKAVVNRVFEIML